MKAILIAIALVVTAPAIGAEPAKGDVEFDNCAGPDHVNRCYLTLRQWNKEMMDHTTIVGGIALSPFVLVGILRRGGNDGVPLSIDMPSEQVCEREAERLMKGSYAVALSCVDRRAQ